MTTPTGLSSTADTEVAGERDAVGEADRPTTVSGLDSMVGHSSLQSEVSPTPSSGNTEDSPDTHRRFLLWPVVVFLLCRGLTLAGLAIANIFTHNSLSGDLYIWDARWFIRAAEQGWPSHLPLVHGHVTSSTIAFFPIFPLAIRWLVDLTGLSPVGAGLIISGMTGLTAIIAVGMLVRHYASSEKAERATLLLAVFPGTFAFNLVYSEGIVITCIAFGLLALLRRQWWLAGLLGLVASATSPIALAFVVSCAWCAGRELLRNRNWHSLLAPALAPLGFVAYMAWLWGHTGEFSAWRLTERGGWKSYPSLGYPVHIITTFVRDPVAPTRTGQLVLAGTVVAVIGAVFAIREHQPSPVLLYGLTAGVLAAISAPVGLRPRFLLLAFPLIVAIGTRLRGRSYTWTVVASVFLLIGMTVSSLASTAIFP